MRDLRWFLFVLLSFAALPAQETATGPNALTVATKPTPPFAIKGEDGQWTGLSIELWRLVAERLGRTTEFVERDLQAMLADTAAGTVDVAVAATTVTAERAETIDFSHPFLTSGLGIATRAHEQNVVLAVLDSLVSASFLNALLGLLLVLAICGVVVWLLERRQNPEEFGGKGLAGVGAGLWFSAVTMTTVGYGDKSPKTFGGRIVALIWMFASIIIISSYTAAIASALTVDSMTGVVRGPQDLPTARVGTVTGSAAARWLEDRRLQFTGFLDVPAAMQQLEAGELDAVVYDQPILRSLTSDGGEVHVLPHILRRESYAFAFAHGSELRQSVNQALLAALESEAWGELRRRYLGDD